MKLASVIVPSFLAMLLLTSCSTAATASAPSSAPASPRASTRPTTAHSTPSSPEVTPSPSPAGVTFSIDCETEDDETLTFSSWEKAWASPSADDFWGCDASLSSGDTLSEVQSLAVQTAKKDSPNDITDLAGLCADVTSDYVMDEGTLEDAEGYDEDGSMGLAEVRGMLVLCPDFPKAKSLKKRAAATEKTLAARKDRTRFDDTWGPPYGLARRFAPAPTSQTHTTMGATGSDSTRRATSSPTTSSTPRPGWKQLSDRRTTPSTRRTAALGSASDPDSPASLQRRIA